MANNFLDQVLIFTSTRNNYTQEERIQIYAELQKESDERINRDYNL
ncbi:MAG TPA: hypothetical protein VFD35_02465 [Pricia sp.]|nr:hypothetical protein [Pricia sp.]